MKEYTFTPLNSNHLTGSTTRGTLTKRESYLLSWLAREDRNIFSIDEIRKIAPGDATKIAHSLVQKRWILPLKKGLYAIVPLDVGVEGAEAFIVHDFVTASHLAQPYYIGYWSALNFHGLSDQVPRTVFIATPKAKMPIAILYSRFYFVKIASHKFFGLREEIVDGGGVLISDPEKTLVDCLDHPEHSGGIDEVGRAIYFSHSELDFWRIKEYTLKMKNRTIFKRLGYLLEKIGLLERYPFILEGVKLSKGYSKLDPSLPFKGSFSKRWGLMVNAEIDPKRWQY